MDSKVIYRSSTKNENLEETACMFHFDTMWYGWYTVINYSNAKYSQWQDLNCGGRCRNFLLYKNWKECGEGQKFPTRGRVPLKLLRLVSDLVSLTESKSSLIFFIPGAKVLQSESSCYRLFVPWKSPATEHMSSSTGAVCLKDDGTTGRRDRRRDSKKRRDNAGTVYHDGPASRCRCHPQMAQHDYSTGLHSKTVARQDLRTGRPATSRA